jgi:hypothetical protein
MSKTSQRGMMSVVSFVSGVASIYLAYRMESISLLFYFMDLVSIHHTVVKKAGILEYGSAVGYHIDKNLLKKQELMVSGTPKRCEYQLYIQLEFSYKYDCLSANKSTSAWVLLLVSHSLTKDVKPSHQSSNPQ